MPVVASKKCVAINIVVLATTVTTRVVLGVAGLAEGGALSVWMR